MDRPIKTKQISAGDGGRSEWGVAAYGYRVSLWSVEKVL